MSYSYAYYNPIIKCLNFILMMIMLLVFPTIIGCLVCLLLCTKVLEKVYVEAEVKASMRKNSIIVMIVLGILAGVTAYYFDAPKLILKGYNITYLYYALFFGMYGGVLYLYGRIIACTTTLFEFWSAVNENLGIPKYIVFSCYRMMLFVVNLKDEYMLVKRMFMTRGIKTRFSFFRIMKIVIRNLKYKVKNNDIVMEAKGFDHYSPRGSAAQFAIQSFDLTLPLLIVLCSVICYFLVGKGWLL